MVGDSGLRESQGARKEKRGWEREGVRESFGRGSVPQGWFLMAEEDKGMKGGRDGCCAYSQTSTVTQKVRPPHWPPDQSLRRQPGGKQDANSHPTQCGEQAVTSLEDRDRPEYPAWGPGGGGVRRCGESVVPTPPHLGQWTKGPPARPEVGGGGVKTTSCQETTSDPATAAVWPRLRRSTRGAHEQLPPASPDRQPPPQGKKSSSSTCPGPENGAFPLICFAQLNFRGHPATSLCRGRDPGAEVKSGARKTRSPLTWRHVFGGNPSVSTN